MYGSINRTRIPFSTSAISVSMAEYGLSIYDGMIGMATVRNMEFRLSQTKKSTQL